MDDFRLRVFIAAARTLSFTKAAEELFISQPAVSKHVCALESAYGVTLFNRRGSRLELTPAGEVLLGCAERLEAEYRRMQYEMSRCTERLEGELRLGASTTVAQYLCRRFSPVSRPAIPTCASPFCRATVAKSSRRSNGAPSTWVSSRASATATVSSTTSSPKTNWCWSPVPTGPAARSRA